MKITHTININDFIKVKLTNKGKNIYHKFYTEIYDEINDKPNIDINRFYPKVDDEGYTKMQLHEFMQIFGQYFGVGKNMIMETNNIIIGEEENNVE